MAFAQRFGRALNFYPRFNALVLVLDGAFASPSERLAPYFKTGTPRRSPIPTSAS